MDMDGGSIGCVDVMYGVGILIDQYPLIRNINILIINMNSY